MWMNFAPVRGAIAVAAAGQKDYQTNKHELDESLKATIRERWSGYFERYAY